MKKQFNHILDIKGKNKVYPIDKNFYCLFFTEDKRFFIYATHTKKDFSSPALIEIDFDLYLNIKEEGVVENFASDFKQIVEMILYAKKEAVIDNLSVGEILKLQ